MCIITESRCCFSSFYILSLQGEALFGRGSTQIVEAHEDKQSVKYFYKKWLAIFIKNNLKKYKWALLLLYRINIITKVINAITII